MDGNIRTKAYEAVHRAPSILEGDAWANANIWRAVDAALDGFVEAAPHSPDCKALIDRYPKPNIACSCWKRDEA